MTYDRCLRGLDLVSRINGAVGVGCLCKSIGLEGLRQFIGTTLGGSLLRFLLFLEECAPGRRQGGARGDDVHWWLREWGGRMFAGWFGLSPSLESPSC